MRHRARERVLIGRDAERLARIILGYLRTHPAASDSLRGIRDWWLHGVEPVPADGELHEALEQLVRAELVCRIENPDGTVLWTAGPGLGR